MTLFIVRLFLYCHLQLSVSTYAVIYFSIYYVRTHSLHTRLELGAILTIHRLFKYVLQANISHNL